MVILQPVNLRWIEGSVADCYDLCAHGDVDFRVGDDVLLDPATSKNLTVSAAALYLLRTLSSSHIRDKPHGENLFPCCGFSMFDVPDQDDVVICGCPNGDDFEVLHEASGSGVIVRAEDGREWRIIWAEWRRAVHDFADMVSEFYASSAPKKPSKDDEDGFRRFAAEWERRRGKKFSEDR